MKPFAGFDTIANAKIDESRERESRGGCIFQVISGQIRAKGHLTMQLRDTTVRMA